MRRYFYTANNKQRRKLETAREETGISHRFLDAWDNFDVLKISRR